MGEQPEVRPPEPQNPNAPPEPVQFRGLRSGSERRRPETQGFGDSIASFQLIRLLKTMLNSPWFCHR
jgi:hypothetical protein